MPLRRIRPISLLRDFLDSSSAGGVVLMVAAVAALIVANSPLAPAYQAALKTYIGPLSLLHWINDALMAAFFLLVGLEIKREFLDGQLATWPRRVLPGLAALGGMIAPAVIFLAFNGGDPLMVRGWAIPTATDIAFALGVLSLLGSRVPSSLKIFLAALAIIDDLGAVLIIAAFYTSGLSVLDLGGALAVTIVLFTMNRRGILPLLPYVALGIVLWILVFRSGIHATIAGVILALAIPLKATPGDPDNVEHSPLHRLEHALNRVVPFMIIPIFGFANAGVSFAGMSMAQLTTPLTLGVALGLVLGKFIGVFGTAALLVRVGWADMPARATWLQLLGVSVLCGIGFTMSLFIGLLAFPDSAPLQDAVKVGILLGSLVAGVLGALILLLAPRPHEREP